jgi:hypothetical protein
MISTSERPSKTTWRQRADAELTKLLEAAAARGFYGTASLTVTVQDGHIQNRKIALEKMVK